MRREVLSISCGMVRTGEDCSSSGTGRLVLLVDPCLQEEGKGHVMDGIVTVACDQWGNVCYVNQVPSDIVDVCVRGW